MKISCAIYLVLLAKTSLSHASKPSGAEGNDTRDETPVSRGNEVSNEEHGSGLGASAPTKTLPAKGGNVATGGSGDQSFDNLQGKAFVAHYQGFERQPLPPTLTLDILHPHDYVTLTDRDIAFSGDWERTFHYKLGDFTEVSEGGQTIWKAGNDGKHCSFVRTVINGQNPKSMSLIVRGNNEVDVQFFTRDDSGKWNHVPKKHVLSVPENGQGTKDTTAEDTAPASKPTEVLATPTAETTTEQTTPTQAESGDNPDAKPYESKQKVQAPNDAPAEKKNNKV
ncbi:signal peptide containing protein [Theileria equi strain WA]|uniref:Signal peptide containing protein n=1 Tax=Theileria equi strain WA TaxID=1537102 RepID=L1LAI1_THEEQ|nr:signal peptide containing protein [Theileria equi strain WA]EKX72321.1 signal peptide containing protein [Theileria equi strain WA]|eukprot:XP_004831773.1 signal peptide containing protein [Theileria equi strain WA]